MSDTPTTPDATLSSHAETEELVDDATFTQNVARRIETLTSALHQVPTGPEGRWLRLTLLDVLGVVHAVSNRLGMLAARLDDAKFAEAQIDCPASAEEIAEARRVLTPSYGPPPGSEPFDPIAANALDALNTLLARVTRHSPPLDVTQAIGKIADALLTLGRRRDTERCRAATQAIVEEIGASGPMSLEEAVAKVLERLRKSEAPRATYPGVDLIERERLRQITQLGYTFEHDDEHGDGELAMAAACYAAPKPLLTRHDRADGAATFADPYPLGIDEDARPRQRGLLRAQTPDERIRLLTKAGALVAAELDRLLRKESHDASSAAKV